MNKLSISLFLAAVAMLLFAFLPLMIVLSVGLVVCLLPFIKYTETEKTIFTIYGDGEISEIHFDFE